MPLWRSASLTFQSSHACLKKAEPIPKPTILSLSKRGVPIHDLPVEYFAWFAKKGFPKGKLGELLKIVHQMKVDGSDAAFDPMRKRNGGRTKLR